ncbi:DUF2752 domain-containing protein [Streptomyces sp. P38-E01]|uniref:DUF2752 domain-containing protein n=1 Tax=Streptomyces tardus TaxID=2780544 RepID=A0A949JCC8_9ACTN|nr:DUF2752 domain-containing protein [Streptomyces tardus]MBU7597251.1 DUF2752 domain-containing protein [Streptomyces tardus]
MALASRFRHPAAAPLAVLGTGVVGLVYLWHTNPHDPGQLLPRCPINLLTGVLCPACGGTRMTYDLLHGDVVAAFHDNAVLLLLGLPLAAFLVGRWLLEGLRGRRYAPRWGAGRVIAVVGVAAGWMVVRNVLG